MLEGIIGAFLLAFCLKAIHDLFVRRQKGHVWPKRGQKLSEPEAYSSTKRVTYTLSEDLVKKVEEYAQKRKITVTRAINEIVRRGLTEGDSWGSSITPRRSV
ncbi:MAG TPA: hypothetical protein EYP17_00905 [Candidatus Latescibacteria bacterium]|nr:hypothetical protein [Candidatus Latescibacterota bacterium]